MRHTLLTAALLVVGCGEPEKTLPPLVPCAGKVTGASGGTLRFYPVPDQPNLVVTASVTADGSFSARTGRTDTKGGTKQDGAPAGSYKVTYFPAGTDQRGITPVELPGSVTAGAGLVLELPAKKKAG